MLNMRSINHKIIIRSAIMLLLLLITLTCFNGNAQSFGLREETPLKKDKDVVKAVEVQDAFRKVYELNKDSVVFISTEQTVKLPSHPFFNDPFFRDFFGPNFRQKNRTQKRVGLGSGFVLTSDGYICTNNHVIDKVDKVKVKIHNITYNAKIIGSDSKTDIALLKINPKSKLKPVYLGDSDKIKVGDWAIAIGNPFGLDRTFTTGIISAVGRKDVDLMGGSQSHIQTDASINPGNSGGALINIYGEVIGINRMIYSNSGGSLGIGFAIPINRAKNILEQLRKHGKIKRGYIGVQIVPLTKEYAEKLGLESNYGALVGGVMNGSPAGKGGVRVGDVIIGVNGKKIKDYTDLVDIVQKNRIGKTLKVTVWRKKSKVTLFITIKERP